LSPFSITNVRVGHIHKTRHRCAGYADPSPSSSPFLTLTTVGPLDTGPTYVSLKNRFG